MEYAVVLRFDEQTESRALGYMESVAVEYMLSHRIPPHVTFAVFTKENETGLRALLTDFAERLGAFDMAFASVAAFVPQVLFLAPVTTARLLALHAAMNQALAGAVSVRNPFYLPDRWVPHMALEVKLDGGRLSDAFRTLQGSFRPFAGRAVRLALAECEPYREMFSLPLS